ncbi:LysR family transcriptional regulator [Paramicrobacterium chengjingii]|uniref:LysR family transcriptional regulator n=1 Tax=Paramicrobacterium chengjingii TaxID=2769067 RepID=UPI0014210DEC|nr:LysR family transcriptional regulator [Microbacterium chengjingii]
MAISTRQLEYFLVTAELGTMTAAAAELFVSQSAISLSISQLEADLGIDLFVRSNPRQLHLSVAGQELLADARRLLSDFRELEDNAQAQGSVERGRLFIGWYQTLGPRLLPGVIEAFEKRYPDVTVHITEGGTTELCAALHQGSIELAVLYDLDIDQSLDTISLMEARPYVLVSPDHELAQLDTISMADLAPHDMILYAPPGEYYLSLLKSHGVNPRVKYRFNNYETVRSFTARGLGYSVLHQRQPVNASYEGRELTLREFSDDVPNLGIFLATRHRARLTRRAQAFIEQTKAEFRD